MIFPDHKINACTAWISFQITFDEIQKERGIGSFKFRYSISYFYQNNEKKVKLNFIWEVSAIPLAEKGVNTLDS